MCIYIYIYTHTHTYIHTYIYGERVNYRTARVVQEVKNLPANAEEAEDSGSIPGSGRSSGAGHGNPLQCSCLENLMDRGDWQATIHGVAKSQT